MLIDEYHKNLPDYYDTMWRMEYAAPATPICFRLLESNAHFVAAWATPGPEIRAAVLLSRAQKGREPPAAASRHWFLEWFLLFAERYDMLTMALPVTVGG